MIAPGYTPEALAILSKKKGGNFIILEGDIDYVSPDIEYREVAGAVFAQQRNKQAFGPEHCEKIVTKRTELPESAILEMIAFTASSTPSSPILSPLGVSASEWIHSQRHWSSL